MTSVKDEPVLYGGYPVSALKARECEVQNQPPLGSMQFSWGGGGNRLHKYGCFCRLVSLSMRHQPVSRIARSSQRWYQ